MAPYATIRPSGSVVVPWFVAERPPGSMMNVPAGTAGAASRPTTRPSTVTTYATRSASVSDERIVASTVAASPALTAWRAWTASAVAWSSSRPPVVCAWSPRRMMNSVPPIASHVTTATPMNARAIRAVSPRGIEC